MFNGKCNSGLRRFDGKVTELTELQSQNYQEGLPVELWVSERIPYVTKLF